MIQHNLRLTKMAIRPPIKSDYIYKHVVGDKLGYWVHHIIGKFDKCNDATVV